MDNSQQPALGSYSISVWFKPTNANPSITRMIFGCGNVSSTTRGVSIIHGPTNSNIVIRVNGSGSAAQRAGKQSPTLTDNNWHHFVGVIDRGANNVRGYLDGSDAGFTDGGEGAIGSSISGFGTFATSEYMVIGATYSGGAPNNRFAGNISDVRIYNRALSQTEITALYDSYNPSINIASGSLMTARWKLDNVNLARDVSGKGGHGTAQGGITIGNVADHRGRANSATSFNGSAYYIDGTAASIGTGVRGTSFWVNVASSVRYGLIGFGSSDYQPLIYTNNTGVLEVYTSTATITSGYVITAGWKHVVVTWDATKTYFYVNGVLVASPTGVPTAFGTTFTIGRYAGTNYLNGSLADIQVHNRTLTINEVKQLYLGDEISKIRLFKV